MPEKNTRILIVAAATALIVLGFDALTLLGWGVWALYLLPVLVISLAHRLVYTITAAAVASAMLFVGFFLSPPGIDPVAAAINRSGMVVLIWLFVVVIDSQMKAEQELRRSIEATRRSEERFRQLANSMPQLVWTADANGAVDYYNDNYAVFGGVTPTTDGAWEWVPVVHEEDRGRTLEAWNHALRSGETYQVEHRVRHADGTYHWYLSRGVPVRDEEGRIAKWYGTATNIDISKQAEKAVRDSEHRLAVLNENLESLVVRRTEQVRALSKALTMAEQRERRRFSLILHENLQQLLFSAKMQLDLIDAEIEPVGATTTVKDDIVEESRLLDKALETTRTLALELNPPILAKQGLDAALSWLVSFMHRSKGLVVDFTADETVGDIRDETQIMVVQMVRELLNNVVQHAGVSKAVVDARCGRGELRVMVSDQGTGFDVDTARGVRNGGTKLGLFSIKERLRLFGGTLAIDSAPGKGTRCTIIIPTGRC